MAKKVLLTGGTGFIGSHIADRLDKEVELIIYARKSSKLDNLKGCKAKVIRGQLQERQLVKAMKGCDTVVHNAALAADWGPPRQFLEANILGTNQVANACIKAKVKHLVLTSSSAVLGEENQPVPKEEEHPYNYQYPYFLEKQMPSGMNLYRHSKTSAEMTTIKVAEHEKFDLTVLRPVWVFGPREFNSGFYEYCKAVKDGNRFLPGSNVKFHTIYAPDLAEVYWQVVKGGGDGVRKFNVGAKKVLGLTDLWGMFCKEMGMREPSYVPKWSVYPVGLLMEGFYTMAKKKDPPLLTRARVCMGYCNNVYDVSKVHKEYKVPFTPYKKAVKTTVGWWKKHGYL